MIKHIVCFKLADSSEASKNKAKEVLMSMVGNVPTIRSIEVGTDFLCSERSYDVGAGADCKYCYRRAGTGTYPKSFQ